MDKLESLKKARFTRTQRKNQKRFDCLNLLCQGYSMVQISKELNRCYRQVQRYRGSGSKHQDTLQRHETIADLLNTGLSVNDIAIRTGLAKTTVYRHIRQIKNPV